MEPILDVRRLTKVYPTHRAVDDLSFQVPRGEIFGFLGENGAGKSTTLRCVLGLIRPTSGQVFIGGKPFPQSGRGLLRSIGAVVERPDMYNYLTGRENLRLFARLCDTTIPESRLDAVLELVGLRDRQKDKVSAYSLGMKQRLGIAIALVHEPELLILDEPTNGLDPQGIAEMRKLIRHLSADLGKTVVVSSHLLSEVEHIATHILILHQGKKMADGPAAALLRPSETVVRIGLARPLDLSGLPAALAEGLAVDPGGLELQAVRAPEAIPALVAGLAGHGAQVLSVRSRHSLEDLFLSLTSSV